ncbi:MAG TPA: glycine cleavage system aminomethyltransferase GcvT [Candidatus Omnitrophota bacterium]|nr:glycine cleavage system aminomethyltransferase GcvT [Candidatus Omnitrophota bacterium]
MTLKRTPLYEAHVALGAKMVPFGGWEMPLYYKNIISEHEAVRNGCGIFDIGHMGVVDISGPGALPFIQYVSTNDASALSEFECQYSILCNDSGGTIDDILVYRLKSSHRLVVNASNTDAVLAHLSPIAGKFPGCEIVHRTDLSMLSVQGPGATRFFPFLSGLKKNFCGELSGTLVSRTGYTGEDGFELFTSKDEAPAAWRDLLGKGVVPCGLGARDTLRIEAGLPLYGHEYNTATSPLEAGYPWAVKFSKGEFIGKAALQNSRDKGISKKLVGLKFDGRNIAREGFAVLLNGTKIGAVTSGSFSPTLKAPVALAYLDPQYAGPGNKVEVEIRGALHPAVVSSKKLI